jgi:hypothetical protein
LSDLCLDVLDLSMKNGAKIQQSPINSGLNQQWQFIPNNDGFYEIVAKHSGCCIDDGNSSLTDGGIIHQWSLYKGSNQLWKLRELSNGYILIISKIGGLCIDGKAETHEGSGIHLWRIHEGDTQQWKLVPIEELELFKKQQKKKINLEVSRTVKELTSIELPTQIIKNIDIKAIASRMASLFDELKDLTSLKTERDKAGFLKKFWWALTGKTTDSVVQALDVQGELLKVQSMLMVLNTMFAKELNKQQEFMASQQEEIKSVNEEIISHAKKIDKQNNELKSQQTTILNLVHLSKEQEKSIRDIVQQAINVSKLHNSFQDEIKTIINQAQTQIAQRENRLTMIIEQTKSDQEKKISDLVEQAENLKKIETDIDNKILNISKKISEQIIETENKLTEIMKQSKEDQERLVNFQMQNLKAIENHFTEEIREMTRQAQLQLIETEKRLAGTMENINSEQEKKIALQKENINNLQNHFDGEMAILTDNTNKQITETEKRLAENIEDASKNQNDALLKEKEGIEKLLFESVDQEKRERIDTVNKLDVNINEQKTIVEKAIETINKHHKFILKWGVTLVSIIVIVLILFALKIF